jgi:hypothetical protein
MNCTLRISAKIPKNDSRMEYRISDCMRLQ